MNRIDAKFENLKAQNKKALIAFITAGDGGYETTERAVLAMEKAGVDIVELGIPFSDPVAEGPVIQNASERALAGGTTLRGVFEMVSRLRNQTDMPLLMMMYLNTIYRFGTERFFKLCDEHGIDGVIVPDMPYEERDEIQGAADKYGKHSISLVAPTSADRIDKIAKDATGFLYCVSSTGVTGMRSKFDTDFDEFFGTIKKYTSIPCAVGFGISNAEQAKVMSRYCDGVIVGSAIVKLIGEHGENAIEKVSELVSSMRKALDE
ncbi:MAG: tryptophan synthase subunit alpha [Clostridiales bacterium]|jgi:tryptophan synthase alpha chain|nr:tryptophan synthase subunit alpha [Clostridiales bacterium]